MNPKEEVRPGDPAGSKELNHFAQLFERHSADAMALAYSRVRNRADAEEVVQDAFLDAYRGMPRLRDPEKFGGWLRSIVVNHCTDLVQARARRDHVQREAGMERGALTAGSESGREEWAAAVAEALAALPDHYREPLSLRHLRGFSYAQVAAALSLPLGTVRTRIARGDEMLKEKLARLIRRGGLE